MGEMYMRRVFAVVLTSLFAVPVPAQQASQQGQQQIQQVECRDLASSGNYLAPNETIINGMACRPAGTPSQVSHPASTNVTPTATASESPAPTPNAAPTAVQTPNDQAPKAMVLEDGTPVNLVLD